MELVAPKESSHKAASHRAADQPIRLSANRRRVQRRSGRGGWSVREEMTPRLQVDGWQAVAFVYSRSLFVNEGEGAKAYVTIEGNKIMAEGGDWGK
jgi:hypothetical protein